MIQIYITLSPKIYTILSFSTKLGIYVDTTMINF